MKDISPNKILEPYFEETAPKLVKRTYCMWGNKLFVNKTARGRKYLYRSKAVLRNQLIEAIAYGPDKSLNIIDRNYPGLWDWPATYENIGWYIDELEKRGEIQYFETTTLN